MRAVLLILVLAVSQAVNETTPAGGDQQQKLGGCNLRCRKLTFIGEGSVPVKPTWALIDLSVKVNSQQLQGGQGGSDMSTSNTSSNSSGGQGDMMKAAMKVREEALHRSQFILNYLKDLNKEEIRDLQTQEISFRPDYSYEDDERKFIGYKAKFGLSFKIKLDKMQEVLDQIVSESGANRVDSIVFVADEADEKKANLKAIELATSNAWEQAQAVAKVLGIQGNLKLLSVRDRMLPNKKVLRRFARRFRNRGDDNLIGAGRGMGMDDDFDFTGMLDNFQGEQVINALLVFRFDFEDGTISFKEVAPIENNMTIADSFGPLMGGGNQSTTKQPETKQPETTKPPEANQPAATNATAVLPPGTTVLPGNTAEMKPTDTAAVVQPQATTPPQ